MRKVLASIVAASVLTLGATHAVDAHENNPSECSTVTDDVVLYNQCPYEYGKRWYASLGTLTADQVEVYARAYENDRRGAESAPTAHDYTWFPLCAITLQGGEVIGMEGVPCADVHGDGITAPGYGRIHNCNLTTERPCFTMATHLATGGYQVHT